MTTNTNDLRTELDLFIKNNHLIRIIKSLKIPDNFDTLDEPSISLGHSFGNANLDDEFSRRLQKVKGAKTLGQYIDEIYKEKKKTHHFLLQRVGINDSYMTKLRKDKMKKPSKEKLLCLSIAFRLDMENTEKLLKKAGYSLASETSTFDHIIGFFIEKGIYSTTRIDECLVENDQQTLFSIE